MDEGEGRSEQPAYPDALFRVFDERRRKIRPSARSCRPAEIEVTIGGQEIPLRYRPKSLRFSRGAWPGTRRASASSGLRRGGSSEPAEAPEVQVENGAGDEHSGERRRVTPVRLQLRHELKVHAVDS